LERSPPVDQQESEMRQALIIGVTVFLTATLTAITMNVIHGSADGQVTRYAPASMDIMDMMKNAKNLPSEKYDAN
jgi:hypothetical protein